MAVILEARFEKADIMNAYINEIYLGQDGNRAIHGFGLASQFYFGKPLAELDLPEIALLVADRARPLVLRPAPPSRARARAAQPGAARAGRAGRRERGGCRARGEEAARPRRGRAARARSYYPAFLDLVRRQLRRDYEEADLTEAGLTVFSTLDPLLQQKAEDCARRPSSTVSTSRPRKQAHGPRGRRGRHDAADGRGGRAGRRAARRVRRLQPRARRQAPDRLARQAAGLPRRARIGRATRRSRSCRTHRST